ncbi:unnamed protein product [Periconia digitata]|uniref:Uncharacterized protein n=1 Tax=Periconia digitata TaxID=1303443 RepID=A0A9W4UFC0_9PLEO|nr:unnamed protein product [Periconia digitata]
MVVPALRATLHYVRYVRYNMVKVSYHRPLSMDGCSVCAQTDFGLQVLFSAFFCSVCRLSILCILLALPSAEASELGSRQCCTTTTTSTTTTIITVYTRRYPRGMFLASPFDFVPSENSLHLNGASSHVSILNTRSRSLVGAGPGWVSSRPNKHLVKSARS